MDLLDLLKSVAIGLASGGMVHYLRLREDRRTTTINLHVAALTAMTRWLLIRRGGAGDQQTWTAGLTAVMEALDRVDLFEANADVVAALRKCRAQASGGDSGEFAEARFAYMQSVRRAYPPESLWG